MLRSQGQERASCVSGEGRPGLGAQGGIAGPSLHHVARVWQEFGPSNALLSVRRMGLFSRSNSAPF